MSKPYKTITLTTSVLLLALSGNASAINKCVSPSGQTSYTDKPCPADSTANIVKVKGEKHKSEDKAQTSNTKSNITNGSVQTTSVTQSGQKFGWQKRWPTLQAYKEYYCANEANKTKTPDEMIARAKAVSSGDLPSVTVCCMNNKPVACK